MSAVHSRRQQILDLDHYLEVLERKPGAMAGSKPLDQWRSSGRWPADYDALWRRLNERHGRQDGTRAMIGVILLGRQFGHDRLRAAVHARRRARRLRSRRRPLPARRQRAAASAAGRDRGGIARPLRPAAADDGRLRPSADRREAVR